MRRSKACTLFQHNAIRRGMELAMGRGRHSLNTQQRTITHPYIFGGSTVQSTMNHSIFTRSLFAAFVAVLLSAALVLPAQAQEDLGALYNEAAQVAQQAQQAQQNAQHAEARGLYAEAHEKIVAFWELGQEMEHDGAMSEGRRLATQFQFRAGLMADRTENYDRAIEHFNQALEYNDGHSRAYLAKAEAYRKSDRFDQALEFYQLAMENGDTQEERTAEETIRSQFHYLASSRLGESANPSRTAANAALSHLEQLQEYVEPNSSTFYYMAVAHEALGDYDEAISRATQALDIFSGSRTDRARIHLVRGEAYMAQGDAQQARSDLEEAMVGEFRQRAEALMEQLS